MDRKFVFREQRTWSLSFHAMGLILLLMTPGRIEALQVAIGGNTSPIANLKSAVTGQTQDSRDRDGIQDTIKTLSSDGKMAAIRRSQSRFEIVDTATGQILRVLPLFADSATAELRLSDNGKTAWAMNVDANSTVAEFNFDEARLNSFQDRAKEPREEHSGREYLENAMEGAGLFRWDLSTGELVSRFLPDQRSVTAFDIVTTNGGELMATAEAPAIQVDKSNRIVRVQASHRIAVSDDKQKLLATWTQPDEDIPSPKSVSWVLNGKGLLFVHDPDQDHQFTLLDVSRLPTITQKWTSAVSQPTPPIGKWRTEAWCASRDRLFVFQSTYARGDQIVLADVKFEDAYRLVELDLVTGVISKIRKLPNNRVLKPGDPGLKADPAVRLSVNSKGILAITGLYTRKGTTVTDEYIQPVDRLNGTLFLDTNSPQGDPQWVSESQFPVFGDSWIWCRDHILSPYGIYSAKGTREHTFVAPETSSTSGIQVVEGVPVLPSTMFPGNVLASWPDRVLLATSEALTVVNRTDGAIIRTVFSREESHDRSETTQYDLHDAVATIDPRTEGFYLALPRSFKDFNTKVDDELRKITDGYKAFGDAPKIPKWQVRTIVRNKYGRQWELFHVDSDKAQPRHIADLPAAVWVGLAANEFGAACASLSEEDRRLNLSLFKAGDSANVTWVRPSSKPTQENVALSTFNWLQDLSWSGSKMQLRASEDSFLLLDGSQSRPGTGPPILNEIDLNGNLIRSIVMRTNSRSLVPPGLPLDILPADLRLNDPIAIDLTPHAQLLSALLPSDPEDSGHFGGAVRSSVSNEYWNPLLTFQRLGTTKREYQTDRESRFAALSEFSAHSDAWSRESDHDASPFLWIVDDSAEYAYLRSGTWYAKSAVFHLPSLTLMAWIEEGSFFSFDRRGYLVTSGGSVPLNELRSNGVHAFSEPPKTPPVSGEELNVAEVWKPRQSGQKQLFYLALGVTQFADKNFPSLDFCSRDVLALTASYQKRAEKDGLAFRPMLMTSASATVQDFEVRLDEIIQSADAQDEVVIVCATHGIRLQRGLYLITSQSRYDSPQATAIGWPTISEAIKRIKARRVTVILDTCHAASFSEDGVELLKAAKAELANRPGLTVLASCGSGESAFELPEKRHGAFTAGLLQAFSTNGIPAAFPESDLRKMIETVQTSTDGRQTPVVLIRTSP